MVPSLSENGQTASPCGLGHRAESISSAFTRKIKTVHINSENYNINSCLTAYQLISSKKFPSENPPLVPGDLRLGEISLLKL